MKPSCEACAFYEDQDGTCRIAPPTVLWDLTENRAVSFFPEVEPQEWCGDFAEDFIEIEEEVGEDG